MRCLFDFPQRKACFTEPAILETMICTREHRGLAHQAAPSCPRSRRHYTVEAAFLNSKQVSLISERVVSRLSACFVFISTFFVFFLFHSSRFSGVNTKTLSAVNTKALTILEDDSNKQHEQTSTDLHQADHAERLTNRFRGI